MKKLKNKVFWVILAILTMFLVSILCIFNYQDYEHEKNVVSNNLIRMENSRNPKEINKPGIPEKNNDSKNNSYQKIFMDSVIYTVLLDKDNNIIDIISHTENGLNDEEIRKLAQNIIKNKGQKNTKIGNLYFEDYSYSLKNNNSLTIVDNRIAKDRLTSLLKTSILIFIFLETIIIYVSIKLTSWIIKPVEETFNKQKQFIADASHELKTPLSVIMASSDALENDFEKKWIDNIRSETERMNRLISNLLDLAKLENVVNKEQYSLHNLSKLIEISVLTFEGLIYENNIKLEYNIQEGIEFNCDNDQIKQLVSILLDNAIKHSTKNGQIIVELEKEKNAIILEIKNKGKAIPKGDEEKIFERFYRADKSRNRNDNRYGLGLAIAKNIVVNHNGKITANSSDGYTTFEVIFKQV